MRGGGALAPRRPKDQKVAQKMCRLLGENGRFLSAARPEQTKWVSQRRENIPRLIDVSSPCICFNFHCQRSVPEAKPSANHNDRRSDDAHLYPTSEWRDLGGGGEERQSGGWCLPLWLLYVRGKSEPCCSISSVTFTHGGVTCRDGIVRLSITAC